MPDESSLLDSRGSRPLSGGNYSSDSGFGGSGLAGDYEAQNQKLDITQRNGTYYNSTPNQWTLD